MKDFGIYLLALSVILSLAIATVGFSIEYGPIVGFSFLSFVLFVGGIILIILDKKNIDL